MKKLTLVAFLLFSIHVFAQETSKIGQKSEELEFHKILNYEKSKGSLSELKDKIVILDFWATWCGACIKSFPRLEELQSKFKRDLQVVTITSDHEERIKRFLNKQKLNLPIVIDNDGQLSNYFQHRSIPHTVVIDKSGLIKAITTPEEITEELITKILANQQVALQEKKDVMDFDPSLPLSGNENFIYQVTITPFKDGYPSFASPNGEGPYERRRILATNLSATTLFEIAHQFPSGIRTIVEVSDSSKFIWSRQNAICFDLIVPDELGEQRFEIMKQHLGVYFDCQSFVEERVRPVKILQRIKGTKIKFSESKEANSYSMFGGRGLSMKKGTIETLARFLESQINQPVINETDLSAVYDLEMPWYNEDPEQIHKELKNLGLELVSSERKVAVLVIKDR